MNKILVEVSVGELLDKISILEIKQEKIKDTESLKFITDEYNVLKAELDKNIKIIGYSNYPSRIPGDASTLFSKNVFNFIKILIDNESKKIIINLEDEIIAKTLISHQGKLMNL